MPSKPKAKPHVRQTTAERQQSQQERVDIARREERRKPARVDPYVEYKNVDPAVETALYYGFTPLGSTITVTKEDKEKACSLGFEDRTEPFSIAPTLEEKVAMFRYFEEKGLHDGSLPVMFCTEFSPQAGGKKKSGELHLTMEVMGSSKSISEATLIQTAFATLREEGHTELSLSLNSVGDRESMNRFTRELGNFYRKHIALLPGSCRSLLRKNPLELLKCEHEKCKALNEEAPKSIGFLGDESRRHFKEVLEFLEELGIPYRIDHTLLGNRIFATETLFEIHETMADGEVRPVASGVRYNNLGKRLGFKREVPSVGLNLLLTRAEKETGLCRHIKFKKPLAFFLQIGFCAKLKSLRVIEVLRQARIPLYQALSRDKLISQISSAENLKIPYSVILGQREALENSVIVRNTANRVQETVKLEKLAEHFRKMKLG
ncbi:MAG: hypothetical protein EXS51_03715 [Candidatus Taylorbacteria bacterium]|nr:hypothetical protein [Candidatus Taylorbacteria bacterium]